MQPKNEGVGKERSCLGKLSEEGTMTYIYIFHLFREGCPSTEVVFQGALQLKTNYNIQLECQKIRTHNIKNLFTTI